MLSRVYPFLCSLHRWSWFVRQRITASGIIVAWGVLFSAVFGIDTETTSIYYIFSILLMLMLASALATHWLSRDAQWQCKRQLPPFVTVDEPFEYQLSLKLQSNASQYKLKVYEQLDMHPPSLSHFLHANEPQEKKRSSFDQKAGYYRFTWLFRQQQGISVKATNISEATSGKTQQITLRAVPLRRGVISLPSISIATPEPLGLLYSINTLVMHQHMLVLPRRYTIPNIFLSHGQQKYTHGGEPLTTSIGESGDFTHLREYRPGDSPRKIHWKSCAKSGTLHVRQHQEEYFSRQALILDGCAPHKEVSNIQEDAFEEAISIAAGFATGIGQSESLLDLMFVADQSRSFTSGRGLAHPQQMLQVLAELKLSQDIDFSSLATFVLRHANQINGAILLLLNWDDSRQSLVNRLLSRNISVSVLLLCSDPKSSIDAGVMRTHIKDFHVLDIHNVQAALSCLK